MARLESEFRYYREHQSELMLKYNGKFIAIRGAQVFGPYDSDLEAVRETSAIYPLGTFLVQKCEPIPDSYTQMFHSRVTFG